MAESQVNPAQGTPTEQNHDIVRGVVNFFNVVGRTNTKIVYTSLGGNVVVDQGFRLFRGLYLNFPWKRRAVRVSLTNHTLDTESKETFTLGVNGANGVKIGYDADYQIRIVDVEKFYSVADSLGNGNDLSINTKEIYKLIQNLLEQRVLEYIHSRTYDDLMRLQSVDLQSAINMPGTNGATSLMQYIRDNYGVEVSRITFQLCQPKALSEEATKTRVVEQEKLTALQQQQKLKIEEEGRAERTRIMTDVQAEQVKKMGEAEAAAIGSINGADPTRVAEAKEETKRAQAYASGTATVYAFQGGQPNMVMGMPGMMNGMPQQQVSQPAQQPVSQVSTQSVDWNSLPDDEYLSVEDSAQLSAERGKAILPGARYHYSYLTAEEKTRYKVAADKGKTK